MQVQFHELEQLGDQDNLVRRAATFAREIALLNRNTDRFGKPHVGVELVTDRLEDVYDFRPNIDRESADYPDRFVGTCWTGSHHHGATAIWLNRYGGAQRNHEIRPYNDVVETYAHELSHAFTRGQHGQTFRRMFALLYPHVAEAFGVDWKWYTVYDIIAKYGRQGASQRPVSNPYGITPTGLRWDEEFDGHRGASLRMMQRVKSNHLVL